MIPLRLPWVCAANAAEQLTSKRATTRFRIPGGSASSGICPRPAGKSSGGPTGNGSWPGFGGRSSKNRQWQCAGSWVRPGTLHLQPLWSCESSDQNGVAPPDKRFGSTVSIEDYSPVISQRVVLKVPRMYGENCKSRNLLEKQMCVPPSPPITYCKIQHSLFSTTQFSRTFEQFCLIKFFVTSPVLLYRRATFARQPEIDTG